MNKYLQYLFSNDTTRLSEPFLFMNKIIEKSFKTSTSKALPIYLNVNITPECQIECKYCSSSSIKYTAEKDFANKQLLNKIVEMKKLYTPLMVSLGGGEPLLYPERCLEILNVLKNKNTFFLILSNLSFEFNTKIEKVFKFLDATNRPCIQTSIDTLDENRISILRKNTSLELVKKNIDYLKNHHNIKIKINLTLSMENYFEINELIEKLYDLKVDSLHINNVLPLGRALDHLERFDFFTLIDSFISIKKNKTISLFNEFSMSPANEIIQLSTLLCSDKELHKLFAYNDEEVKIDSEKYVCNLYNNKLVCNSGWLDSPAIELKTNSVFTSFQISGEKNIDNKNTFCQNCGLKNLCSMDNSYLKECLLESLLKKLEFIMNFKYTSTSKEKTRNKMLDLLIGCENVSKIDLILTNKCNRECNFCLIEHGNYNKPFREMEINHLLDQIGDKNYIITISGGEPLMEKEKVLTTINRVKQNGSIVFLLTNLTLLDEDIINMFQKRFGHYDVVQTSIYAAESKLHNSITGRDDWHLLNENIKKLLDNNVNVRCNLTLTPENLFYLQDIFDYYRGIGVEHICINGLIKKGKALNLVDEKYIIQLIEIIYNFLTQNVEGFSLSLPIEFFKFYSNIKKVFGFENEKQNIVLSNNDEKIIIDYDGSVYYSSTLKKIGNISDIVVDKLKSDVVKTTLEHFQCENCFSASICKSKFYHMFSEESSSFDFKPYCDYFYN